VRSADDYRTIVASVIAAAVGSHAGIGASTSNQPQHQPHLQQQRHQQQQQQQQPGERGQRGGVQRRRGSDDATTAAILGGFVPRLAPTVPAPPVASTSRNRAVPPPLAAPSDSRPAGVFSKGYWIPIPDGGTRDGARAKPQRPDGKPPMRRRRRRHVDRAGDMLENAERMLTGWDSRAVGYSATGDAGSDVSRTSQGV
jgi:hypothetical protein